MKTKTNSVNNANKQAKLSLTTKSSSLQKCLAVLGLSAFAVAITSATLLSALGEGITSPSQQKANADTISDTLAPIDSAKISLSITNATGSSSSSSPDISITSPSGGGIATGHHTLTISSNSGAGYTVNLSSNTSSNTMTGSGSSTTLTATSGTASSPATLTDNTWGYALPGKTGYNSLDEYAAGATNSKNGEEAQSVLNSTKYTAVPTNSSSNTIITSDTPSLGNNQVVYYGAKVAKNASAATYTTNVKYTATVKLPGAITIDSISPNNYALGSTDSTKVTIKGNNLETAYEAWIDFDKDGQYDKDTEACTISYPITNTSSTDTLTCAIPTGNTIKAGTYNFYVLTQNGNAVHSTFTYTETGTPVHGASICKNAANGSNCKIDIDANMIPIKYAGDTTNPKWVKADISKEGDWYDYENKKWANAVTVTSDKVDTYKSAAAGTDIPEDDVLGYWVYIPRYEYKVLRYSPANSAMQAQDFTIIFQTKDDVKDIPTQNNEWATHPAFTWGNTELNGIWVGKYETTGGPLRPKVKPSVSPLSNMAIGDMYDTAIRMGVTDTTGNQYGNKGTTTPPPKTITT